MTTTRPQSISIARHETFHFRDGWLLKGLQAIRDDPTALSSPDIHHQLGVGKNMASAIRYWVQAVGLAEQRDPRIAGRSPLSWTPLAEFIVSHDQFLEDIATLWLVHIELASNAPTATFWYWAFNEYDEVTFSDDDLSRHFLAWVNSTTNDPVNLSSIKKEVNAFLRTYRPTERSIGSPFDDPLDCPLSALSLVVPNKTGKPWGYSIGAKRNLPAQIVGHAILRYRQRVRPELDTLSIDELRWLPLSPGRLLQLDTRSLTQAAEAIEEMSKGTWLQVYQTAGVRNVRLSDADPMQPLRHYFDAES